MNLFNEYKRAFSLMNGILYLIDFPSSYEANINWADFLW